MPGMNFFQRALAQLREFWASLSAARRFAVLALGTLALLALGTIFYLSGRSDYRVVFPDLTFEEVGAITEKLKAENIPYKLGGDGTRILVPEDRALTTKVLIASSGITVKGSKGFEIFDDAPLGMTPFVQNVNYVRALQAELARSITQLEPVASARVIIARSEPSPFIRDQKPTTASVVLKLKVGANLNRSTAAAITSLVSRSVEGLKPEHVTIVDSSGHLLSDPRAGEGNDGGSAQLDARRELETYLRNKAEEMLNRHLGPGRAVVSVSTDLNFQKVKERIEQVSPEGKAILAERSLNTKSVGGTVARGPVGAVSNTSKASSSSSGGGNSTEEKLETDYAISRTIRELEDRAGAIKRMTIAAMVDLSQPGEGQTPISLADVQEILKQALGFQQGRDEIKVANVKLSLNLPLEETSDDAVKIQQVQAYVALARNVLLGIALVVTFAMFGVLFFGRGTRRPDGATTGPEATDGATPPAIVVTALDEAKRREERQKFIDQVLNDPDRVARTISLMVGSN
jgi:flagellar M-ring protein FliF